MDYPRLEPSPNDPEAANKIGGCDPASTADNDDDDATHTPEVRDGYSRKTHEEPIREHMHAALAMNLHPLAERPKVNFVENEIISEDGENANTEATADANLPAGEERLKKVPSSIHGEVENDREHIDGSKTESPSGEDRDAGAEHGNVNGANDNIEKFEQFHEYQRCQTSKILRQELFQCQELNSKLKKQLERRNSEVYAEWEGRERHSSNNKLQVLMDQQAAEMEKQLAGFRLEFAEEKERLLEYCVQQWQENNPFLSQAVAFGSEESRLRIGELSRSLNSLQQVNYGLEEDIEGYRSELADQEADLVRERRKNSDLLLMGRERKREFERLNTERAGLEEASREARSLAERCRKDLEQAKKESQTMKTELSSLLQHAKQNKAAVKAGEAHIQSLSAENRVLKTESNKLHSAIETQALAKATLAENLGYLFDHLQEDIPKFGGISEGDEEAMKQQERKFYVLELIKAELQPTKESSKKRHAEANSTPNNEVRSNSPRAKQRFGFSREQPSMLPGSMVMEPQSRAKSTDRSEDHAISIAISSTSPEDQPKSGANSSPNPEDQLFDYRFSMHNNMGISDHGMGPKISTTNNNDGEPSPEIGSTSEVASGVGEDEDSLSKLLDLSVAQSEAILAMLEDTEHSPSAAPTIIISEILGLREGVLKTTAMRLIGSKSDAPDTTELVIAAALLGLSKEVVDKISRAAQSYDSDKSQGIAAELLGVPMCAIAAMKAGTDGIDQMLLESGKR